ALPRPGLQAAAGAPPTLSRSGAGDLGATGHELPAVTPAPSESVRSADSAAAPGVQPSPTAPPVAEARWRKLAEVACAINVEHELSRLLERILDAVLELVPAKSAFLVLLEDEVLRVRANRGQ